MPTTFDVEATAGSRRYLKRRAPQANTLPVWFDGHSLTAFPFRTDNLFPVFAADGRRLGRADDWLDWLSVLHQDPARITFYVLRTQTDEPVPILHSTSTVEDTPTAVMNLEETPSEYSKCCPITALPIAHPFHTASPVPQFLVTGHYYRRQQYENR